MELRSANIFVTGGAGTLGRAIAARRKREGWTGRLTVYSSDDHKHNYMRKFFPDVQYVQGDIRNPTTLYNAMCGHDIVIHAAAVKVIPTSEWCSIDTFDVNVNGSLNVADCAVRAGISNVLGISTDKACHSVNAYGSTKYMMEKCWQEFSRVEQDTIFNLVRYGNVLESTGSVIEAWKKSLAAHEPIKITNPEMTRFWLSPQQAVTLVVLALKLESGTILIPKMPALSIGTLAQYTLGSEFSYELIPLRPGEKIHEELRKEHSAALEYNVMLNQTVREKTNEVAVLTRANIELRTEKEGLIATILKFERTTQELQEKMKIVESSTTQLKKTTDKLTKQ